MVLLTDQVFEIVKVHTLVLKYFCRKRPTYSQMKPVYILSGESGGAADESNC